ncbi:pyruvate dehydrogenase E1 component alpha subunit [Enhydrobacter aerosaccus]|uniref:Pyruvate dehydrogenase E1 component alpha subunit n=1 Tax=Enhydrobacter aerosaccus TaxID=225324 RepID=A0A1T4KIV7_9HYPH|nr:thiamine pyrophosphate-dependent dehydrogenase E1 component subunit alpha [Enhydrobacter aerosaccus]SJZ42372.1 pyruvate dehydrogenase E1 component alpha subunit [Enhydrobacter aerosaccus]
MSSRDELYRRLFRTALLIRLVEQRIIELYPSDKIQSPVHLSIGQEAVAVGACDALRKDDVVFATYRSHAFYIAKGGRLDAMFAELYGRMGGVSKGKAGSMHLSAPEVGLMGSSAVVASAIPHAVGAALAFKRRKSSRIAVTVFGDGATEEGVYHESLNFAALTKAPVLFLCEDNGLAVHSHRHIRQSYGLLQHAASYGIATRRLDEGWDAVAVREATVEAVERVRAGEPFLLEIATARYKEHVGVGEDFHFGYRAQADIDRWKRHDPLIQDRQLVEALTPEVEREIAQAVAFAESSPTPGRAELLTDVL